jgi:hypothetical protein
MDITKKIDSINLSHEDRLEIKNYISEIEKYAEYGKSYYEELIKDVVKLSFFKNSKMDSNILESIAAKLDINELKSLKNAFDNDTDNIMLQFKSDNFEALSNNQNHEFFI